MNRIGPCGGSPTQTLTNGQQGFVDQNLSTGQQGTGFVAAYENNVQEEMMSILAAAGVTPNAANYGQVLQSILLLQKFQNQVIFTPTTSGSFVCPAGILLGEIEIVGGGGAGGEGNGGAGGGGAAGGYARGLFALSSGTTYTATVGNGGSGSGTAGGPSTFGALLSCGGGSAGTNGSSGAVVAGGLTGGVVSVTGSPTNVVEIVGHDGAPGISISSGPQMAGAGGSSGFGGGQPGAVCSSGGTMAGVNGIVPGCGGAGGAGAGLSGQGGPGIIIVRY